MWHIQTMEYYLAIKSNKALMHATMWMDLESMRQYERSQSQKVMCDMIPFI